MADPNADPVGAFIPGPRLRLAGRGAANLPLAGLTFGAKDLFDVAGHVTGCGNPDWRRTHPPATGTAPAVQALLDAGATLVGKTKTQELAYGLTGENPWEGTPTNPAAPERFPGGSSCGSAAAVAAGLCDVSLGTDTGGSVRIPASYCGIFGIRPSHGAVSLAGVMPMAPSFDTVGWFARDAATLARLGDVLLAEGALGGRSLGGNGRGGNGLGGNGAAPALGPLVAVSNAWDNADAETEAALRPALKALEAAFGPALSLTLPWSGAQLYEAFRCAQGAEAWTTLGPWVERTSPAFGPGVQERFLAAKALPAEKAAAGRAVRAVVAGRMRGLLGGGAVLVYPTAPGPAPLLGADAHTQQAVRERIIANTAIAGLAGLCEVSLPAGKAGGAPVGLSLVAAPGQDRALLALARAAAGLLGL
ncbi:MAG: amidase [Alphaproteobacteria bacterium]|nr:amidase [Alphaproteobacteria bacterium]